MIKKNMFTEVIDTIRERGKHYGTPDANYKRIAGLWSLILKTNVTPKDVLLCMVATKLCREIASHKRDNVIDMAGYLKLYLDMEDSCKRPTKQKKIKIMRKK